jgi:MFS family permease
MSSPSAPDGVVQPLSDFRRRLAFSLVLVATMAASLVFSILPPILPALAAHFGGGRTGELSAQLGLAMPSLGWLIGGGISGWIVGRAGMRPTIVGAMILLGVSGVAAAFLPDVLSFAISRLVLGFAGAFMITVAITLLADIYDDDTRPKMIGYQKATGGLAAIPIALAVGALADAYDWRAAFYLYAVFGVLAAALAFVAVPHSSRGRSVGGAAGELDRESFRRLMPILVLIFFLHILPIMGVTQLPFILAEHGFTSATNISIAMAFSAALNAAGAIMSGYLQTRLGPWKVLAAGVLLAGAGYVSIGLAPNGYLAVAANAVGIFGCGLYFTQYLTLPLARVAPGARAKAIGLLQVATYLSSFTTPFLMAPIRGALGHAGTYIAIGATAMAAVAVGVVLTNLRPGARGRAATVPGG